MAVGQLLRDANGRLLRDSSGRLLRWVESLWHDISTGNPGNAPLLTVSMSINYVYKHVLIRPPDSSSAGTLWCYVTAKQGVPTWLTIKAISEDWNEATCTSTNWPAYGATLVTGYHAVMGWNSIALSASAYGYVLTLPWMTVNYRLITIASSEHSDTGKRPYWVG